MDDFTSTALFESRLQGASRDDRATCDPMQHVYGEITQSDQHPLQFIEANSLGPQGYTVMFIFQIGAQGELLPRMEYMQEKILIITKLPISL
jgi:hypothetical protein